MEIYSLFFENKITILCFLFIYLSIYRISKVVFLKKLFHSRFLLVFKYPSRTAKWFHCNLSIYFFLNNLFFKVSVV